MHLAIIGATGDTGQHLIRLATQQHVRVTALARNVAKLAAWQGQIAIRRADARDPESLRAALDDDVTAVVNIVGASGLLEARKVVDLYSVATTHLISAMQARGLDRLITVSSGGVEPQPNDGWFYVHVLKRFFLEPMYADMRRMEQTIRTSPMRWTIARAPYLLAGAPTGVYRERLDAPFADDRALRRGDLAHFLLKAAQTADRYDQRIVSLSE